MTTETWRPIPGFEGYEVSSEGRVKRLASTALNGRKLPEMILATHFDERGYARARLRPKGREHHIRLGPLVAAMFIGDCPPGHLVTYRNGDRTDVRAVNLKYATNKDIANRGEENPCHKLTEEDVADIRRTKGTIDRERMAAEKNVSVWTINDVRYRRSWTHV